MPPANGSSNKIHDWYLFLVACLSIVSVSNEQLVLRQTDHHYRAQPQAAYFSCSLEIAIFSPISAISSTSNCFALPSTTL